MNLNPIEVVAFISGVVSVYLTVKQNIWCWPIGIINVIAFTFLFYDAKLYSDMGLQIIYFVLSIYGWYNWLYGGKNKTELPITRSSRPHIVVFLCIFLFGTVLLGYLVKKYTNASTMAFSLNLSFLQLIESLITYIDASQTMLSLIGQFTLSYKKLESWIFWIIVDIISIAMYHYKGLYLTEFLYIIFLILAISGYTTWKKEYKLQKI